MDQILFINSCVRPNSRTYSLAESVLARLNGDVQTVRLDEEHIPPLDGVGVEKRDELLRWLAFGKLADNQLAVVPCVVASPQNMVNVTLGNRKGEGRWCALRLIDGCNLFRFRQHREVEKVQLLTVGLNPYHCLQGFLHCGDNRGRRLLWFFCYRR